MKSIQLLLRKQFCGIPLSFSFGIRNFKYFSRSQQPELSTQKSKVLSQFGEMISYRDKKATNHVDDSIIEISKLIQKNKIKGAEQAFDELVSYCSINGSVISLDYLNALLRSCFKINTGFQIKIHNYIIATKQEMNSQTIYYLSDFYLDYKGFNSAYNILVEASLLNINVDFNTIISLYTKLDKVQDPKIRKSCKYFIENYVGRCFGEEDKQIIKKLNLSSPKEKPTGKRGSSNAIKVVKEKDENSKSDNLGSDKEDSIESILNVEELTVENAKFSEKKKKWKLKLLKKLKKKSESKSGSAQSSISQASTTQSQSTSQPTGSNQTPNSSLNDEIIKEMIQETNTKQVKSSDENAQTNTKESSHKETSASSLKPKHQIKNLVNETKRKFK